MPLVLDDFSADTDTTTRRWSMFTDQVMGGVSEGSAALEMILGRRALRLRGRVSLERNGGFVQVARPLGNGPASPLDARQYAGLAITVCGRPGPYFIHLRTPDARAPWQYYAAALPVKTTWTDVLLRWADFTPESLQRALDVSRLQRLGVVAAKEAFAADIAIAKIALVP